MEAMDVASLEDENHWESIDLLTAGSATSIADDGYVGVRRHETLLTMQVVDMAILKYELSPFPDNSILPRESFRVGKSVCFVKNNTEPLFREAVPYQLQLTDGQYTAPAKFYKTDYDMIHQLVKSGELKKGSIITFKPNSHVESGSGIVTIFDLRVVGWKSHIIGNNEPCHPGVLTFSPRNLHCCTVPMTHVQREALPRPIMRLAKLIETKCGYCTVTGSAPLDQYLQELPGCAHCYESCYSRPMADVCSRNHSNDVDLFVPQYPEGLDHYRDTGERLETHGDDFVTKFLPSILKELHNTYGLRHTEINRTKIRLIGFEDGGQDYGWMRVFVGLKEKLEFQLVSCTGQVIDKPIQILVMNAFPATQDKSWSDIVVDGFDADIIKGVAEIDDTGKVVEIKFSSETMANIHSGKFEYTMRPCHSFPQMLKRLNKYKRRGFELASFGFDSRVSREWRDHILLQFDLKYAPIWIQEWRLLHGVQILNDHVTDYIMPFLESRSQEELEIQNRNLLRSMVRSELERTDGYDPGHVHIDMEELELNWGLRDGW